MRVPVDLRELPWDRAGNFPDVAFLMPADGDARARLVSRSDLEAAPSKEIRVDGRPCTGAAALVRGARGRRKIRHRHFPRRDERARPDTLLKTLEEPLPPHVPDGERESGRALWPPSAPAARAVQLGPVPEEVLIARLRERMPEGEARERAARAQGSFSRALAVQGEWRSCSTRGGKPSPPPTSGAPLDLAEARGRGAALEVAEASRCLDP